MGLHRRRARTLRRALLMSGGLILGAFVFLLTPQPTGADIVQSYGAGCTASINGTVPDGPIRTDAAIPVQEHTSVMVTLRMSSPLSRRQEFVSFGVGPDLLVGDEVNPSSDATTIAVDKYATYGVGLYRVQVKATTVRGDFCFIEQYVRVEGNPLATVAGGSATGLEVLSLLGISAAGFGGANPGDAGGEGGDGGAGGEDPYDSSGFPKDPLTAPTPEKAASRAIELATFGFCLIASLPALLLTSAAMVGGAGPGGAGPRLPRVHWRPYFSVVGMLSGIVGGAAAVVLLQQTSKLFPTYEILGRALVAGLLAGILIPSLTRLIAVRRANRRIAARELARSRRSTPPPAV
jgi:hypothetical protein